MVIQKKTQKSVVSNKKQYDYLEKTPKSVVSNKKVVSTQVFLFLKITPTTMQVVKGSNIFENNFQSHQHIEEYIVKKVDSK